jgi:hypothetical protein
VHWRPGDAIPMRSVYHGRVAWALPHTFDESTETQLVWLSTPGTRWQGPPDGDRLVMLRSLVTGDMQLTARTWHSNRVLRLTSLSGFSSIDLYWDNESDAFLGWYVNLQAPPVRPPLASMYATTCSTSGSSRTARGSGRTRMS